MLISDCPHLLQAGEITDPLVDSKTPVRNSDNRKPDASDDSPFCATCIRNQHMVQSSLAQFEWPEDENGAEYLARDKKYHLLSQDLRSRYPEVCADCEPRVLKRLGQASYTAQTDHLRRMITKTRSQRTEVKSWGALDFLDLGGKWAWHASYVLQFTWHVATVFSLAADSVAMAEVQPAWILPVAHVLRQLGNSPLGSPRVLTLAIQFGLCSFPWNPRFKQSIRGFTAHILGFKQWYTFQLLAVLVRTVALSASQYALSHGLTPSAQLGAQVFLAIFTIYVGTKCNVRVIWKYADYLPDLSDGSGIHSDRYNAVVQAASAITRNHTRRNQGHPKTDCCSEGTK